jgi:hypothetical protein
MSEQLLDNFIQYASPFLQEIEKEHKYFVRILKKSGFKNERDFLTQTFFRKIDYEAIATIVGNQLDDQRKITNDKVKEISQAIFVNGFGRDHINNTNVHSLSEKENKIFQKISTLFLKLYINFSIHIGEASGAKKAFVKPFLEQYLSDYKSLYKENFEIDEIISHIDTIRTPAIEELNAQLIDKQNLENKNLDDVSINVELQHLENVFSILKIFFDEKEQPLLYNLLNGRSIKHKLIFKGEGNKLLDAFRKMQETKLILTSKKELHQWLAKYFQYSAKGVITNYSVGYAREIISSNKQPCVNSIQPIDSYIEKITTHLG